MSFDVTHHFRALNRQNVCDTSQHTLTDATTTVIGDLPASTSKRWTMTDNIILIPYHRLVDADSIKTAGNSLHRDSSSFGGGTKEKGERVCAIMANNNTMEASSHYDDDDEGGTQLTIRVIENLDSINNNSNNDDYPIAINNDDNHNDNHNSVGAAVGCRRL